MLRLSPDSGECDGIVPTECTRHKSMQLSLLFEVLSKTLSTKARALAQHISRLSIKVSLRLVLPTPARAFSRFSRVDLWCCPLV